MSGFSVDWLSLREPLDHQSVNAQVRASFVCDFGSRASVRITDLGCGSGSHLRSLAPHLGAQQSWRLVDYDAALLQAARDILGRWSDSAENRGEQLFLRKDGRSIDVTFLQADLVRDLDAVVDHEADAITSAAFFDLASPDFIARFAAAMAARTLPLYTILTYDGREIWTPTHHADEAVLSAFHAHQATDKGFGAAAGPRATGMLAQAFTAQNYKVETGSSPWRLGPFDRHLMQELARGIANAVSETGRLPPEQIAEWLATHLHAEACEIGHQDLYAKPD
jgi:hypothetical protein